MIVGRQPPLRGDRGFPASAVSDGIRSTQGAGGNRQHQAIAVQAGSDQQAVCADGAAPSQTALYWFPLLMLMTGARPNELARLHTDDLHMRFNGRPHLNVLCLLDDNDEEIDTAEKEKTKVRSSWVTGSGKPRHPRTGNRAGRNSMAG